MSCMTPKKKTKDSTSNDKGKRVFIYLIITYCYFRNQINNRWICGWKNSFKWSCISFHKKNFYFYFTFQENYTPTLPLPKHGLWPGPDIRWLDTFLTSDPSLNYHFSYFVFGCTEYWYGRISGIRLNSNIEFFFR